MKVLFGSALDGCPAPSEWRGVGKLVCGPQGLLDMLEQTLGLAPLVATAGTGLQSELSRLTSYREVLRSYLQSKPDAFFARSFAAESLSTSGTLLRWRDELRLAGWDLNADAMADDELPTRLRQFSEIEKLAPAEAHFCKDQAQRISRLIDTLQACAHSGVESMTVVDDEESLPLLWRNLLQQLKAEYDPSLPTSPLASSGSALHLVQDHLLGGNLKKAASFDAADGTVRMVSELSEVTLAQAAAHQWRDESIRSSSTLIAPATERIRLNEALQELDLPSLAASPASLAATLQQLTVLSLRLHWKPFDPQAWLEFLLHPVCPLPSVLRYDLANAINRTPGRGNEDWNKALARASEKMASYEDEQREKVQARIDVWLNIPGFDPQQGASGQVLGDTLIQLAQWLANIGRAKSAAGDEDGKEAADATVAGEASSYIVAALEMRRFGEVLASMDTVSRSDLERLLSTWLVSTNSGASKSAELGGLMAIASPSQLLSRCEHVSWWKPADSGSRRSPWLRAERDYLAQHGVILVEPEAILRGDEQNAQRAVLHAGQSLTLYSPVQSSGGETVTSSILTRLLAELGSEIRTGGRDFITSEELPVRTLPEKQRWWQLADASLIKAREQESYSSISKLIYSPYQWVLSYQAKLCKGKLFDYRGGDDFMRRGTLLHDLAGRLFASEPCDGEQVVDWAKFQGPEDLQKWLFEIWPKLLEQRGAQYLLPINEFAGKSLLHTAQQALWKLTRLFQEAEVTSVEVEKYIGDVPFAGGKLNGYIDMVLKSPHGATVLDLKLGGKAGRKKELEENRHLQLALYGRLLQQSEGLESSTAFYIFGNGGQLLTRSADFFPSASPLGQQDGGDGGDWSGCWKDFEQVWNWRWTQLKAGKIEVTVSGTSADPDQAPPLEHWAAPDNADYYNDFDALTGWSRIS